MQDHRIELLDKMIREIQAENDESIRRSLFLTHSKDLKDSLKSLKHEMYEHGDLTTYDNYIEQMEYSLSKIYEIWR